MDEVVEALEKYKGLVPLVYDIETLSLDVALSEEMQYAVYLKREADKVIARQKYKRCLAMAEACMHKRWRTDEGFDYARSHRHMNKWMEIAEKFKEAK